MKLNKKTIYRSVSVLLLLFALTFSSNAKASSPIASSLTTNFIASTADLNIVPAKIHPLTWSFWRRIKRWFNNNCSTCGASSCGGHDNHEDNHNGGGSTDSVPLDGGLSLLLLGATAIGVRKLRSNKDDKI